MTLFKEGIILFRHPCSQLILLSVTVLSYMILYATWDRMLWKKEKDSMYIFFFLRFLLLSLSFSVSFSVLNSSANILKNTLMSGLVSFILIYALIPPTIFFKKGNRSKAVGVAVSNVFYPMIIGTTLAIKWEPCIPTKLTPIFLNSFLSHLSYAPEMFTYAMGVMFVLFQLCIIITVIIALLPKEHLILNLTARISIITIIFISIQSVVNGRL